jgi:hypothetical protein
VRVLSCFYKRKLTNTVANAWNDFNGAAQPAMTMQHTPVVFTPQLISTNSTLPLSAEASANVKTIAALYKEEADLARQAEETSREAKRLRKEMRRLRRAQNGSNSQWMFVPMSLPTTPATAPAPPLHSMPASACHTPCHGLASCSTLAPAAPPPAPTYLQCCSSHDHPVCFLCFNDSSLN